MHRQSGAVSGVSTIMFSTIVIIIIIIIIIIINYLFASILSCKHVGFGRVCNWRRIEKTGCLQKVNSLISSLRIKTEGLSALHFTRGNPQKHD
jgi:hypothetical protein